jgi:Kef-type K+ transport system membrane component KefB/mannitol/fructose-specific phosphotransferase system IIA component (Ntr-type)
VHHDVLLFLLSLAVLLGSARLFGAVVQRFGMPAVVGEIIAGLVVGKTLLGRLFPDAFAWLFPTGAASTLLTGYTTVAAVLLLVVAGFEIDLTVVKRSSRTAVVTSLMGAIVPFAFGYGAGLLLPDSDLANPGRRGVHAAFLGIALSISALPVIARTLLDLGLMKTDLGLIVLSAAIFDDLAGWIGFSVLSREFVSAGSADLSKIGISVGLTVVFVVGTLLVVRPLADRLLARLDKPNEDTSGRVLSMIMILAMLGASVTQALDMHAVFGGFVMGLAIGDSSRLREHTRAILREFVTSVFTPVFFATMALRVDFAAAFDLRLVAIVLAIACVAKIAGCAVGARISGVGWRESTAIGFGMNSRGAMEILLALLALEANIINPKVFVALVCMAIATSLMSGPAMMRLLKAPPSPVMALLRAGVIELDLRAATSTLAITNLATALAERAGRSEDAGKFAKAALAREEIASTAVGQGVAFPHAEVPGLPEPLLALGRSTRGLAFDAPDGEKVKIVLLLLVPPKEFELELRLLSGMARLLTKDAVRRGLIEAEDTQAVMATLEAAERAINAPSSTKIEGNRAEPAKG